MNTTAITGNTYPVRSALAAMGGYWDKASKAWMVPSDKADAARKLVSGASKTSYKPARPAHSARTGCSCGSVEGRPRATDCRSCKMDY